MRYNDNSLDKQVVTDVATEPVTLEEVKRHLNLQFDTEGAYTFTDDDTYLTELISQCRETIEEYTGLSLAEKTLKVVVRNELGDVEVPWGPVYGVVGITDNDNETVTATLRGNQFKWIEGPCSCYLVLDYVAGYNDENPIPRALKRALLEEIAFRYNNRGDQMNQYSDQKVGICQGAIELATPFKRKSFLV